VSDDHDATIRGNQHADPAYRDFHADANQHGDSAHRDVDTNADPGCEFDANFNANIDEYSHPNLNSNRDAPSAYVNSYQHSFMLVAHT
jgi:hypothetical protein